MTHQPPDLGTGELLLRMEVEVTGDGSRRRAAVINHPLDKYYRNGQIDMLQLWSGERLLRDWALSHCNVNLLIKAGQGRGYPSEIDDPFCAGEAYRKAMASLRPKHQKIAEYICRDGWTLEEMRKARILTAYFLGLWQLRNTLDSLVEFYEVWDAKRDEYGSALSRLSSPRPDGA